MRDPSASSRAPKILAAQSAEIVTVLSQQKNGLHITPCGNRAFLPPSAALRAPGSDIRVIL